MTRKLMCELIYKPGLCLPYVQNNTRCPLSTVSTTLMKMQYRAFLAEFAKNKGKGWKYCRVKTVLSQSRSGISCGAELLGDFMLKGELKLRRGRCGPTRKTDSSPEDQPASLPRQHWLMWLKRTHVIQICSVSRPDHHYLPRIDFKLLL